MISIRNTTGVIQLARPKALNSLNREMVDTITQALEDWRDDDSVTQVLIHAPEKGFCAGGDVRAVRDLVQRGEFAEADEYFVAEYSMNHLIDTYPKPYGALADGIIMGGGQGVSMHGDYRVVTEKSWASMPEMAIGYITDVGMSHKLQTIAGRAMGRFLALTAYRLGADDLLYTGLATHVVDTGEIDAFVEEGFEAALANARTTAVDPPLARFEAEIADVFGHDHWDEIVAALDACENKEFVELVHSLIDAASPAALIASAELLAVNADRTLRQALDNELSLGKMMIREPDFLEGVRAVLVDKTRDPQFSTPRPAAEYRAKLR